MSEDMIERVARAICDSAEADNFDALGRDSIVRALYVQQARHSIEAMREPTKWMHGEGMRAHMKALYTGKEPINSGIEAGLKAVDLVWPAMIDAALKEAP